MSPVEWADGDTPEQPSVAAQDAAAQPPWYQRYVKLIAGALGTLTPQTVFAVIEQNGGHVNQWLNLAVTTVFAVLAIWRAPANKPKLS